MQNWAIALIVLAALIIIATARNFALPKWLLGNLERHWRGVLAVVLTALALAACFFEHIRLGLDLKGGTELLYRINVETVPPDQRAGITATTISVLDKRLSDRLSQLRGTSEMRIQEQGSYRILIQVPGADAAEVASIKSTIQSSGRLEFRLVNDDDNDRREAQDGRRIPGHTPFVRRLEKGETEDQAKRTWYEPTTFAALKNYPGTDWLLISHRVDLTGELLARANATSDEQARPAVGFEFNVAGKKKFALLTDRNIGKRLAIVLDNKVYSAPVIRSRIAGAGIIEGSFTETEVQDLVTVLRGGILPAQLSLELENTVGPTLGLDSIRKGITATFVGTILVGIFMIVYYFGTGAIAVVAVVSNIILILGVMALTGQTLTLPGIAGLVLTMAMAVDANVLINERIREEKERGKTPKLAVAAGYERAFSVIFDSHVTGIITSVILYYVGTGPVQGFAVTLGLGLIISLYTALFITRTMVDFFLNRDIMTRLRMLHMFSRPNFQFMKARYICYAISLTIIVIGMTVFVMRGSKKYDIDFTGGTLLDLELKNPLPIGEVRKRIGEAGYPEAEVQGLWAATAGAGFTSEAKDFGIRIPARAIAPERMDEKIKQDLDRVLTAREALKSVRIAAPLKAEVLLAKGMDEAAFRDVLRSAGYLPQDIADIEKPPVLAAKFQVWVKGEGEKDQERSRALAGVVQAARDLLAAGDVSYNFGKIVEEAAKPEDDAPRIGPQLEMSLSRSVDANLIQIELENMKFSGITVLPREKENRGEAAASLYVRGPKDVLEKLRAKASGTLALPAARYLESGMVEVDLKQPILEDDLKGRLEKQPAMVTLLDRVVPLGAAVDKFTVAFKPLSETKLQEEIRDDIAKAFKGNITSESIAVKIEPVPPPPLGPEEAPPPVAMSYFVVKFPNAVSWDVVRNKMIKAGHEGTLYKTPVGEEAAKPVTQVTLQVPKTDVEQMLPAVTAAFESADPFRRVSSIGASVAEEMKNRAFLALVLSWVAIILYLWFRFGEAKFGVAAVVALVHDVLIAMGFVAIGDAIGNTAVGRLLLIGDIKINLTMVAAFLTIIGYSVADTIVVYDRIRENRGAGSRRLDADLVNTSVNQTLNRTVLTSVTVGIVLLCLYIFGGPVIHGFAFCMLIGILTGTYSSIFIASPIIVDWVAWSNRAPVAPRVGGAPQTPQKSEQRKNNKRT